MKNVFCYFTVVIHRYVGVGFVLTLFLSRGVMAQCTYLSNTDFENSQISVTQTIGPESLISPWYTTASDKQVEIWRSGFQGVPAFSGNQFIELNANVVSTIFQNFTATPGSTFTLNFAHRGRQGNDVMNVSIGSPIPVTAVSGTSAVGTIYADKGSFTDGNTAWGYYSVSFTIPISATGTSFSVRFTSVSAAGGNASVGNFLDAISIGDLAPATTGSSLTIACPATTADLTSLTATNKSTGTVQTWHTGPVATDANKVSSPASVGAGVYFTAFYNTVKQCYGSTTRITVTGPTGIPATPTLTVTQPTCGFFSGSSGAISVTSPTGSGLTYSINGTTYTNTSGSFPGLAPGVYSVTVKNSSGCISAPTTATLNTPASSPSTPTASVTAQPSCTLATGTIVISSPTASGNTYSIDGSTYSSSTTFTGVVAGTYAVSVKNSNGCVSGSTSVTVTAQPPTPVLTVNSLSVCAGTSTTLTTGGCTGGTVRWSTGDNTTSIILAPVVTTVYTVTCTNSSGCSGTTSATVTVRSTPTYTGIPIAIPSICTGATVTNSGRISFSGLQNTERADISIGSTYTSGPTYGAATNKLVAEGAVLFSNLPNPAASQPYTIRLYAAGGVCYSDTVISLDSITCQCPAPNCIMVAISP